jgi:hypothetical protein
MSTPCSLKLKRNKVSKIFSGSRAFQIPACNYVPWAISHFTFFATPKFQKRIWINLWAMYVTKKSDCYRNKSRNLSVFLNLYFITRKVREEQQTSTSRYHIDYFDFICKANICWDCWVFVNCPVFKNTKEHNPSHAGSLSMLRWEVGDTYSLSSIRKSSPQSLDLSRLARSNGSRPNRVGSSHISPEHGNRFSFRNIVLFCVY